MKRTQAIPEAAARTLASVLSGIGTTAGVDDVVGLSRERLIGRPGGSTRDGHVLPGFGRRQVAEQGFQIGGGSRLEGGGDPLVELVLAEPADAHVLTQVVGGAIAFCVADALGQGLTHRAILSSAGSPTRGPTADPGSGG